MPPTANPGTRRTPVSQARGGSNSAERLSRESKAMRVLTAKLRADRLAREEREKAKRERKRGPR